MTSSKRDPAWHDDLVWYERLLFRRYMSPSRKPPKNALGIPGLYGAFNFRFDAVD